MSTHIDTCFVRYACNCIVDPGGWMPRDSEPNGNTRDLDPVKLRTAINRAGGPRDSDESARVVEQLKKAKERGVRVQDFDAMAVAKVPYRDPETKQDTMVWSAAPGRCPQHDAPVVLSATFDYIAEDPKPEDLGVIDAQRR